LFFEIWEEFAKRAEARNGPAGHWGVMAITKQKKLEPPGVVGGTNSLGGGKESKSIKGQKNGKKREP